MSATEREIRHAARRRCRARFPLSGRECHVCGADAAERHHLDGDPRHNADANVRLLCRACHGVVHSGERWHADRAPARWHTHQG